MTRLHQGMPHHAHRPSPHSHHASPRSRRPAFVGFADDWHAGGPSYRQGGRRVAQRRAEGVTENRTTPDQSSRRDVSHAAFALTLLSLTGLAAATVIPAGPHSGARSLARRSAMQMSGPTVVQPLPPQSQMSAGVFRLLDMTPASPDASEVAPACLPAAQMRALGATRLRANSLQALRAGREAYRQDIQRALVRLIRETVAASDSETRAAFANAEIMVPFRLSLSVGRMEGEDSFESDAHEGGRSSAAKPVIQEGTHAIVLKLRSPEGDWNQYALSLSGEAPGLISPVLNCVPRHTFWPHCFARTYGPVFWGENWRSIASRIGEKDELRFQERWAGPALSPGWPSADSSVLDSPDMEEIAELLIDTVSRHAPRDRRHVPQTDVLSRVRRHIGTGNGAADDRMRELTTRMALSGFGCLAAMVRPDSLRQDAMLLLEHLWPEASVQASRVPGAYGARLAAHATYGHEPFGGALGQGVQWSLPPDAHVEYRPDLTQNGVQVFDIDGVLYGTTVARTRKHASDLRPLDEIRAEAGPYSLCRISRGMGADVDGMCLECHSEREGQVTVTEQGATLTQHQVLDASPLLRLRVAVYSQQFQAENGRQRFFAFGRLGELDANGVPHVGPDSPLVDASIYAQWLDGEITYYEQATTDGPVGGRRIHLTLGDMHVAVPFGTYRDPHGTLHGVVRLSREVYYRFSLPTSSVRDGEVSQRAVRLSRRDAAHRDIREYRIAQRHRAAAENAIVLPTISYGETRTLLQLYLRMWEQAPSPADVWRGLEDIPLSVDEARQAVNQLTREIAHQVETTRGTGDETDGPSRAGAMPVIDPALLPTFHRLWSRWQRYPAQAEAFIGAVARDFVSRPAPLAVWSQLPFTGDEQTTRDVLSLFEEVFPGMAGLSSLVDGNFRAARAVDARLRALSRGANIALAEVTLTDGTRSIYYCISGIQRSPLPTNKPSVRFVDAGRAYAQREHNVITQRRGRLASGALAYPTEPPALRFAVADANMPTYHVASGEAKSRTLDTERLILAQIYADHPAGEGVVRSIVMCSRMPFCDSCAVNLAMVPYHYPDAALRFYYVAPTSQDRTSTPAAFATRATTMQPMAAAQRGRSRDSAQDRHVHSTL